jgi:hypothetical protein
MKTGIGPARIRQQFQDKLVKLDSKIASLEAGIEPFRREREMVMEMLAVHDKHHPVLAVASGDPADKPAIESDELPAMLKRRPS